MPSACSARVTRKPMRRAVSTSSDSTGHNPLRDGVQFTLHGGPRVCLGLIENGLPFVAGVDEHALRCHAVGFCFGLQAGGLGILSRGAFGCLAKLCGALLITARDLAVPLRQA